MILYLCIAVLTVILTSCVTGEQNGQVDGYTTADIIDTTTDNTSADDASDTTQEAITSSEVTSEKTTEPVTTESDTTDSIIIDDDTTEEPHEPYDSSLFAGLVISEVYGTGNNIDSALRNGFIQIYNTNPDEIDMYGLALYYRSGQQDEYSEFRFGHKTIGAHSYYLVRCGQAFLSDGGAYNKNSEILRIDQADAEWSIVIDNKNVRIALAPSYLTPDISTDVDEIGAKISYFIAQAEFSSDLYTVDDLSKNKIAVKTSLTSESGYHLVNLTRSQTPVLESIRPRTSAGDVNTFMSPKFDEVVFSSPAGCYTDETELTLTAPDGYRIFYTTDGSDPQKSGILYEQSILLEKSTDMPWGPTIIRSIEQMGGGYMPGYLSMLGGRVIKAYATDGENSTQVFTNTYFIGKKFASLGISVMNMSLDVDDFISEDKGAYNTFVNDIWGTRPRSTAYLEVFSPDGKCVGGSYIDFAVSGNGSSGIPMKSLRLYYKGELNKSTNNPTALYYDLFGGWAIDTYGNNVTSFERLLIRNSGNDYGQSYLRDSFCQRMAKGVNVDSMAYTPVLVFVNGEFWGMYNCRERYSQEYFAEHYGVKKDNVAMVENVSPLANGSWNSDYVLSQGNEGDEKDFLDLVTYMKTNDYTTQEYYDYVSSKLDIDSYIDYWIVSTYYHNTDWPGNNIKVWRNKNPEDPSGMDTKWRFCLLDMDFCLPESGEHTPDPFGMINTGTVNGAIMYYLMQNGDFRCAFAARAYYLVNNVLDAGHGRAVLEQMAAGIEGILPLQYIRWGGNLSTWRYNLDVMYDYISKRPVDYLNYMYNYLGMSEEKVKSISDYDINIMFTPSKADVYINGVQIEENGEAVTLRYSDEIVKVTAVPRDGFAVSYIEFIDENRKTTRIDKPDAKINAGGPGTLYIHTESIGSD